MVIGELRRLRSKAVDVRRLDYGIAGAGEVAVALVIGQDEHDVRPGVFRRRRGRGEE